ncbi:hypothetical protein OEZ86_005316 [Tetradesmus obliquus]|nr:hypothetical protein OEZ86_005316 [Tetradesmus obliquus]
MDARAIDPSLLQEVQQQVKVVKDEAAAPQERVLALLRLYHKVMYDTALARAWLQALLQLEGVKLLADIVSGSWPLSANCGASSCSSDTLVQLTPDLDPPLLGWSPVSGQAGKALRGKAAALTRSLRRVAADLLADLVDASSLAAKQLFAQGHFAVHFPVMLQGALERYIYGQTKADQRDHADQAQQIAERLLVVAWRCAHHDHRVADCLARDCALTVCKCYKNPWQVKWEPQHKRTASHVATASARAALNRSNLHSAGSSRIWRDITPPGVSPAQAKQGLETWDAQEKYDKMTEAFGNFMIHVAATPDQLLQWVTEADANTKVARIFRNPLVACVSVAQLTPVCNKLAQVWDSHARQLSREMQAARLAGEGARADSQRAAGNEHFKAGRYEEALEAYMAALSETPVDCRLYMNISLSHLRLGRVNEAYDVARSGLAHEPSNSKAWVRLGDACREAGRWQLAALSYRAALDLGSSGDADVQARHEDAASHLQRTWSWEEVPPPWDVPGQAAWLKVGGARPGHQAGYEQWLRKAQKEMDKLHHTSRSIAVKLKAHLLTARALAAARAGQLARLPAAHEWQMSWSDTPFQAPVTGRIRHTVQVADLNDSTRNDDALMMAPAYLEGQPGAVDCINAMALACFYPPSGLPPYKPASLSLSFRMLTDYEQLRKTFTEAWGIPIDIETKTEAMRAAVQYDTQYMGRNYEELGYKRESLFDIVGCKLPDTHNDHQKPGAAAAGAAAAASSSGASSSGGAGGSSSSATRSNAAAAAAPAGSSSSGGKKKKKPQQQQQQQQAPPGPVVRFEETDDGFVMRVGDDEGQQQQGLEDAIHVTLGEQIRQRPEAHGWQQVLGAVSTGRLSQQQVQQLSDMVASM